MLKMPVEHELLTQIQQLKNEKNRLVDLLEKERAEKIKNACRFRSG
ncbi:hypothetical protein EAMG_05474 [Escherichia coli M056]|nr:hypothetical protein EAMG_05474 [Escherichia coli M056]